MLAAYKCVGLKCIRAKWCWIDGEGGPCAHISKKFHFQCLLVKCDNWNDENFSANDELFVCHVHICRRWSMSAARVFQRLQHQTLKNKPSIVGSVSIWTLKRAEEFLRRKKCSTEMVNFINYPKMKFFFCLKITKSE